MTFWICITIIATSSVVVSEIMEYKKKKMIEDHKTNNLALAYQILSTRPEATLDDVQALIDVENAKKNMISQKNTAE